MFLAIINDTYGVVKNEVSKGHSNLGPYLVKIFQNLFHCKVASRKVVQVDIAKPDGIANMEDSDNDARNKYNMEHSSAGSLYPPSSGTTNRESDRLRKRVSELIRE